MKRQILMLGAAIVMIVAFVPATSSGAAAGGAVDRANAVGDIAEAGATTGEITLKPGTDGCIHHTGSGGCQDGVGLSFPAGVVVSPDGKSAYVASQGSSDAVVVLNRNTTTGKLTQPAGLAGCISETGSGGINGGGSCQDGTALDGARDVVISPDGKFVYAVASVSDAITIFDRNTTTGRLTQKAGTAGCISDTGSGGECGDGRALEGSATVAMSADGASVYVGAGSGDAVAIFDRNATTGALTQKPGTAGCISETGSAGACQDGRALDDIVGLSVSLDGKSVYAAAAGSDAIAVFTRNTSTGALVQKAGTAGCISETGSAGACQDGKALSLPIAVEVTQDGASAYVASDDSDAVAIFDRNPTTGELTQKAGTAGCVSETGTAGTCQAAESMDGPRTVAPSPDSKSVYVAGDGGVTIFDRNGTTGALTQKVGLAGCVSEAGTNGLCAGPAPLHGPQGAVVSPNGKSLYVVSGIGQEIATFDRQNAGVAQSADLALTMVDSADPVQIGLTFTVDITVSNDGPGTADVTQITASLPPFAQVGSGQASAECTIRGGRVMICNLPPIAPGASRTVGVDFISSSSGTVTTSASVRSTATDPHLADNADVEETTLGDGTKPHLLRVTKSGDGAGTVTSQPLGINCGSDCSERYADGTLVTLTATSAAGSTFMGFTGSGCTSSPCTVTMDSGATIDAAFDSSAVVDTTPPTTRITASPNASTTSRRATFEFTGSDDITPKAQLTFQCRLDGSAYSTCTSPRIYTGLQVGDHVFTVRARDAAGNRDASPAKYSWTVRPRT